MEKINLLKPDVVTGFLSNGKGQEITYLNVDPELSSDKLGEDITNGATYLKEVRELAEKKPNRTVVVKCRCREEGLLAVSYLASIYNRKEGISPNSYYDTDEDISQEKAVEFEDFAGPDVDFEDFDDAGEPGEPCDDWQESDVWEENPWKIPVIDMTSLCADSEYNPNNPFYNNNMGYGRMENHDNRVPYWRYTRKENLCIVYESHGMYGYSNFVPGVFKRYKTNRHIFVLVVDPNADISEKFRNDDDDEDCLYFSATSVYESALTQFVLEYSADIISIHHNGDKLEKYYRNLFENWIEKYGFTLCKGFPVESVSKKILMIDNADKSQLFDKVVSYVIKDIDKPRELSDEDFNVLYRLKGLGFKRKAEEKEHISIRKLEKSLVGLDGIKDEITGIVETFKYNRKRKAAGLQTGGYHNVHMMLGAPGTAKTTVAKLLGEIMAEEHLLRSNNFISVNGAELKGMFVGHSAPKVKSLFQDYDVIFIDEAYAVAAGRDGDTDSFSQEAIAQLIVELEEHGMDRLVIFAGYGGPNVSEEDNKMKAFLKCNPGIRSRINSTLLFDSYNAEQMVEIFRGQARNNQYVVSKSADKYVREFFETRVHERDFGNGREARSLLENAAAQAAKRLSKTPAKKISKKMLQQLTVEDVQGAIDRMKHASAAQSGMAANKTFGFMA